MASKLVSVDSIKAKTIPIFKNYPVNKAILFGSYASNSAGPNSDVDLYIETNGELKGLNFVGLIEKLVEALGLNVDLIDKAHIDDDSKVLKEIKSKGMLIYEKSKDN